MKLGKCAVENFGSYESLEFDFSNLSLALVYGPTGSGKSTLCDMASWTLLGLTAKNGAADDVRSWTRPESPTKGILDVITRDGSPITVTRIRGKANQNDLYWVNESGNLIRGKDIKETQQFLNTAMGIDADLYLNAVYYSEFSPVVSFFTANAKARRELFEKIADLVFPITLGEKATEAKQSYSKELEVLNKKFENLTGQLISTSSNLQSLTASRDKWEVFYKKNLQHLQQLSDNFEINKKYESNELSEKMHQYDIDKEIKLTRLRNLIKNYELELNNLGISDETICNTCGQRPNLHTFHSIRRNIDLSRNDLNTLEQSDNKFKEQWNNILLKQNTYAQQIESELNKENPFSEQVQSTIIKFNDINQQLESITKNTGETKRLYEGCTQLYTISKQMQGIMVNAAVSNIQDKANYYLSTYFDSEFTLTLTPSLDTIDCEISRNGYSCNYRQLSKGQKGMLKLCFSIAVMQVAANNAGITFQNLFFDESLDGLDADLKIKAYGLFSELALSHESIIVIDHATEFKSLFQNQFEVTLTGDISRITSHESKTNET